jgi:cell division protein FtsL
VQREIAVGSVLDFLGAKERQVVLWSGGTFLGLLVVAFLFLAIGLRVAASDAQKKTEQLQGEISQVKATNERLSKANERLRREISSLKEPRNIAKFARDDLGMVQPDELVFFVAP